MAYSDPLDAAAGPAEMTGYRRRRLARLLRRCAAWSAMCIVVTAIGAPLLWALWVAIPN